MNAFYTRLIFCSAMLALLPITAFAQEIYEHGHGAMQVFDSKGIDNTPTWVMYWVYFMVANFAASLLFVKKHTEARWVAGGFIAGIILVNIATRGFGMPGFSGLIALTHIVGWTPALIILLKQRPFLLKPVTAFTVWSGVVTFVIIFSFVFDIRDAAIFLSNSLSK